jgi:hypothetical protein
MIQMGFLPNFNRFGSETVSYWQIKVPLVVLNLSNPIFLPPTYSPVLIYFGRERGWWITCNYPTVLKEKNINRNKKVQPVLSVG